MVCSRCYDAADQVYFAELSGDCNPLHLDALAARRTPFGAPVVHGLHLVFWALETACGRLSGPCALNSVRAVFRHAVTIGVPVELRLEEERAEVRLDGAVQCALTWSMQRMDAGSSPLGPSAERLVCRRIDDLTLLHNVRSSTVLGLDRGLLRLHFPHLERTLPPLQLAILLALSRAVGMDCPGERSLLTELQVDFEAALPVEGPHLTLQVETVDPRYHLVAMTCAAPGARGNVKAFLRPVPVPQPDYAEVRAVAPSLDCSAVTALVVGGSRGLGEVTTKLLCAWGARVVASYARCREQAEHLRGEILAHNPGAGLELLHLDVTEDEVRLRAALGGVLGVTHLFYFATPPIFTGRKGNFSERLYREFLDYYVLAFHRVLATLPPETGRLLNVFLPSSAALDEPRVPGLGEYTAAKGAAEALAMVLSASGRYAISCPRLPRMATDQTVSLLPVENRPVLGMLAPHLQRFLATPTSA